MLPNEDVRKYFKIFKTTENRINLYAIFIERCSTLISKNGILCFINPNSMLINESYKKLRHLIVDNVSLILKLPDNVFLTATVETIILLLKNKNLKKTKGAYFKNNDRIDFDSIKLLDFDKSLWKAEKECRFNIFSDEKVLSILNHIEQTKLKLEDFVLTSLGITPYDKMKGQSENTIKNREFHSKTKISKEYVPLISGKNIHKFFITDEIEEFLKYGNWLGAPREERFFTEPKIIVRQILGEGKYIIAAYSDKKHYFTQIGFSLISKKEDKNELKFLCAILNSKLCSFYHANKFLDKEKTVFQKILIANARQIPIPSATKAQQQEIIRLVDKIISAKNVNPLAETSTIESNIDKLIYTLYGLTDEEINVIEN